MTTYVQSRCRALEDMKAFQHIFNVGRHWTVSGQVMQAGVNGNNDTPFGMYGWDCHGTQLLCDDVSLGLVPEHRLQGIEFWGSRFGHS